MTDPSPELAALEEALDAYLAASGQTMTALRLWMLNTETQQASLATSLSDLKAQLSQPPPPAGWPKTLFLDDFTDDLSKWHVRNATTQNNTYCNNFAANVTTRNGQLVITGKRETTTVNVSGGGTRTCDFSSGYVDTSGALFSVPKGSRTEIRAVLPTVLGGSAKGLWPAGWFRDKTGTGEVDLFEAWGEPTTIHSGYRVGSFSSSVYKDTNDAAAGKVSNWGTAAGAPAVGGVLHTYWMEWDNDGIRLGFENNPPHVNARYATTPWLAAAFPSTMELRINLQIGDNYWGQPDGGTVFPVEFRVESVRVLGK